MKFYRVAEVHSYSSYESKIILSINKHVYFFTRLIVKSYSVHSKYCFQEELIETLPGTYALM